MSEKQILILDCNGDVRPVICFNLEVAGYKMRVLTDENGEYRFVSIKPGAYPWRNHDNAWRPAHIHFSVFGRDFLSRLVTQMYFPGDPLLPLDPILNGVPDEAARQRLVSTYAHDITSPEWALGYRFNIVMCGSKETPFETKEV